MLKHWPRWLLLTWFISAAVGCDLPRDPQGTYQRLQGGTLRVGVINNSPWARLDHDEARGVEPQLVRQLAKALDAHVQWIGGSEQDLMGALEHNQLDLVVGGLTHETPWRDKVGLTLAYITTDVDVGAQENHTTIKSLRDQRVAVPEGSALAAMVKAQGGTPVEMKTDRLPEFDGLVAAARWQLRAWGRTPLGLNLAHDRARLGYPTRREPMVGSS